MPPPRLSSTSQCGLGCHYSKVISDPLLGFDAILVSSLHGDIPTVPSPSTATNSLCREDVTGSEGAPLKVVAWQLSVAFCGSYRWADFPSTHDLGQFLPRWHTFICSCPTDVSMSRAATQGDPFLLACSKATERSLELSNWARGVITQYDVLLRHRSCRDPCLCSYPGVRWLPCIWRCLVAFYMLCDDGARAQTSRTDPEGAPQLPDP